MSLFDLYLRQTLRSRSRFDRALVKLLLDYDPFGERPSELRHRCRLPKVADVGSQWLCPRCGCPWIVQVWPRQWTSVSQADSRPPWETTLVRTTKSAPGKPLWHFDREAYNSMGSGAKPVK